MFVCSHGIVKTLFSLPGGPAFQFTRAALCLHPSSVTSPVLCDSRRNRIRRYLCLFPACMTHSQPATLSVRLQGRERDRASEREKETSHDAFKRSGLDERAVSAGVPAALCVCATRFLVTPPQAKRLVLPVTFQQIPPASPQPPPAVICDAATVTSSIASDPPHPNSNQPTKKNRKQFFFLN